MISTQNSCATSSINLEQRSCATVPQAGIKIGVGLRPDIEEGQGRALFFIQLDTVTRALRNQQLPYQLYLTILQNETEEHICHMYTVGEMVDAQMAYIYV